MPPCDAAKQRGEAMRLSLAAILLTLLGSNAHAATLSCREDDNTRSTVCYNPREVRVNGNLRSFALYMGGPAGVDKNMNTAVVNCKAGYLELRDPRGVVFARDQPSKLHIVQLRDDVCAEANVKQDVSLK
jgi:hypothetical protein